MSSTTRHSRMRLVTVKMPEGIIEVLNMIAEATGRSRSELIREAVVQYIINNYNVRFDPEIGVLIYKHVRVEA